jgi:hypothetical protein
MQNLSEANLNIGKDAMNGVANNTPVAPAPPPSVATALPGATAPPVATALPGATINIYTGPPPSVSQVSGQVPLQGVEAATPATGKDIEAEPLVSEQGADSKIILPTGLNIVPAAEPTAFDALANLASSTSNTPSQSAITTSATDNTTSAPTISPLETANTTDNNTTETANTTNTGGNRRRSSRRNKKSKSKTHKRKSKRTRRRSNK